MTPVAVASHPRKEDRLRIELMQKNTQGIDMYGP